MSLTQIRKELEAFDEKKLHLSRNLGIWARYRIPAITQENTNALAAITTSYIKLLWSDGEPSELVAAHITRASGQVGSLSARALRMETGLASRIEALALTEATYALENFRSHEILWRWLGRMAQEAMALRDAASNIADDQDQQLERSIDEHISNGKRNARDRALRRLRGEKAGDDDEDENVVSNESDPDENVVSNESDPDFGMGLASVGIDRVNLARALAICIGDGGLMGLFGDDRKAGGGGGGEPVAHAPTPDDEMIDSMAKVANKRYEMKIKKGVLVPGTTTRELNPLMDYETRKVDHRVRVVRQYDWRRTRDGVDDVNLDYWRSRGWRVREKSWESNPFVHLTIDQVPATRSRTEWLYRYGRWSRVELMAVNECAYSQHRKRVLSDQFDYDDVKELDRLVMQRSMYEPTDIVEVTKAVLETSKSINNALAIVTKDGQTRTSYAHNDACRHLATLRLALGNKTPDDLPLVARAREAAMMYLHQLIHGMSESPDRWQLNKDRDVDFLDTVGWWAVSHAIGALPRIDVLMRPGADIAAINSKPVSFLSGGRRWGARLKTHYSLHAEKREPEADRPASVLLPPGSEEKGEGKEEKRWWLEEDEEIEPESEPEPEGEDVPTSSDDDDDDDSEDDDDENEEMEGDEEEEEGGDESSSGGGGAAKAEAV